MRHCAWIVALFLVADSAAAQTPVTSFSYVSQAGDYIGQGQTRSFTPADGAFTATKNFDNGVSLSVLNIPSFFWYLDFSAPGDVPLTPGHYPLATRFPFQLPSSPGLSMGGDGRGCNTLTGEFTVIDVVYGAGDAIVSFAADFEQHCEGMAPAVFGSIRYNFVPPPFTVSPTAFSVGAGAQSLALTVVATPPSGQWSAVSNDPWIAVPAVGSGGIVPITVARNDTTTPRSGSFSLAGRTVVVSQRGNGVPGRPGRPSATVQARQGHFAWLPADTTVGGDAATYRMEVGIVPGGTSAVIDTTAPSLDVSGVPTGRFYLRVTGTNEFGTGPTSDEVAVLVSATGDTLPEAPRDLNVTLAQSQPTFSWSPAVGGGAVTYVLEAGSSTGASDRAVVRLGTATSLAPGLVPAGVYFIRVRAVNAVGVSPPSNEVLLRIGSLTAPPGPPVLSGTATGSTVALSWTPSTAGDAATRYRVEAGAEAGATALVQDLPTAATGVSFVGVPPGRYFVRVRGLNARGVGPASNEVQIRVP